MCTGRCDTAQHWSALDGLDGQNVQIRDLSTDGIAPGGRSTPVLNPPGGDSVWVRTPPRAPLDRPVPIWARIVSHFGTIRPRNAG